jgi:hypothetical protein
MLAWSHGTSARFPPRSDTMEMSWQGLLDDPDSPYSYGFVAIFFVSYVLIVGVVLMNIVVAVLLDEFITTVASEKATMKAIFIHDHVCLRASPFGASPVQDHVLLAYSYMITCAISVHDHMCLCASPCHGIAHATTL